MKQLKVTLKRSPIGSKPVHRENLHGLGLNHPNQTRVLENTPAIRGMIKKVIHMVEVEEIEENNNG
jgi:large subunit ribosomal protein L30